MNKIVGLIGEDPNDTEAIKFLLQQKICTGVSYQHLMKNVRGHQLDNERTRISLKIECERKKPEILIFIRDVDGICTQKDKINKCEVWHKNLSKELGIKNILLLNIYELEALIFADISAFNSIYKTSIKGNRNVTYIKEPKEELIRATRKLQKKYSESDCPQLFKAMNIENVLNNCAYFRHFFDSYVAALSF